MAYSTGKIAVITGAGSGIGRALATQLNDQGCKLLISDISEQGLQETVRSLSRKDVLVESHIMDVADKGAFQAWASSITEKHGNVDIVINNAGVATDAPVEETKYEDIEWLMGINFWGVVYGTMELLPLLRKSPQGHLVNISSIFGVVGIPTQSAYNASKFAVRGYTEALRHEMAGSNIHVCCVHPGGIKTNIVRNARLTNADTARNEAVADFDKLAHTTAESAAAQIIRAIENRKKRLLIGWDAKYMSLVSRLFPVSYARFLPGLGDVGNKSKH
ncbi:MAG: short-subunit dehydrogenase [Halioglobus sp.]|jgi:short-subunit dehydrogenase